MMNGDEWTIDDVKGFVVFLHDVIHEFHPKKQNKKKNPKHNLCSFISYIIVFCSPL